MLDGVTSNGFVARIAAGTGTARTITPGIGISVINGDGVAGNPTISVSGLTTTEIAPTTLITDLEGIASNNNNTSLPTTAAVFTYAAPKIVNQGNTTPSGVSSVRVAPINLTTFHSLTRFTIYFRDVSFVGTDNFLIDFTFGGSGPSSTYSSGSGSVTSTAGLIVSVGAAARAVTGKMTFNRVFQDATNSIFVADHSAFVTSVGGVAGAGVWTAPIASPWDEFRFLSTAGGNFDGGTISYCLEG